MWVGAAQVQRRQEVVVVRWLWKAVVAEQELEAVASMWLEGKELGVGQGQEPGLGLGQGQEQEQEQEQGQGRERELRMLNEAMDVAGWADWLP